MFKKLIYQLGQDIVKDGLVLAMKKNMEKCNTKVNIKTTEKIREVLLNSPGILTVNHPAESDVPIILSAIEDRKDVFLIINAHFMKLIPNTDKYLIPVYIYNKAIADFEGKLKTGILNLFRKVDKYSPEEEHRKNIESIGLAIEKINQGGLIIIFPDGGNKKHHWFNGVGYLIHGVKNKEKSFVTMAHIEGTSNWDYLRLIPIIGKLFPKINVCFSDPLAMVSVKKRDSKTTTQYLEKKYLNRFITSK